MSRFRKVTLLFTLLSIPWLGLTMAPGRDTEKPSIPETPKKPVFDEYHGSRIEDDYRWLESRDDPAVRQWSDDQNRYARWFLDRLPSVEPLRARLTELEASPSPDYGSLAYRGGVLFALKSQPPKQQAFLVTLSSPDDLGSERVLVDPNVIDPKGRASIDFFVPSPDGKRVAVSLSEGGSESGTVSVYEVPGGKKLADVVPRVNGGTAGGSLAWSGDGSGFWYTRYPREGERPAEDLHFYQQIAFHKLGAPTSQDTYALGKEFPRIAEIHLLSSDDGRFVLASVANGDGGQFAFWLLGPSGAWTPICGFADEIVEAEFGPDGALYLLSRKGAPRGKILRLSPGSTKLAEARTAVAQGPTVIHAFEPTENLLYVVDIQGGPSGIRVYGRDGRERAPVPLTPIASVRQVLRFDGDVVLFATQSYLLPPAWYRYDPAVGKSVRTALFRTSPADFSDTEVVKEIATSKDGTTVPIYIVRRKGTKATGSNPTLLTGYGGYGISMSPAFSSRLRAWIEQGGIWAVAILRGGGEFGEDWHHAGSLARKQNVFDDFAACARRLVQTKLTSRSKLAIEGGSNGGLLMGAALTQQPDLFRAVVSHVGIYDMLRVETTPNGAFNVTEFGSVKDPEQFRALYAYSPYHHVVDGKSYPAVLFLTGANDPRVDPYNSRKMTARLQAASSKQPVLLRTSSTSGHGIGTALDERIAEDVDVLAFLFDQLGVKYRPVAQAR